MSTPTLTDIPAEAEARAAANGSLLRLATAGSVDDGKSTLVGRLLFDSKSVLRDQLAAVEARIQANKERLGQLKD